MFIKNEEMSYFNKYQSLALGLEKNISSHIEK